MPYNRTLHPDPPDSHGLGAPRRPHNGQLTDNPAFPSCHFLAHGFRRVVQDVLEQADHLPYEERGPHAAIDGRIQRQLNDLLNVLNEILP